MGPESCTTEVKLADGFTLNGRVVTLIDIPGFDNVLKSDMDILKIIAAFLAATWVHITKRRPSIFQTELLKRYEKGLKLSGIIYIHRISDDGFGGIADRNLNMFHRLCGASTLRNAIIVTNMWEGGSRDIYGAHERELSSDFFKSALDAGAQIVRHHNTVESAHNIIWGIVENDTVALKIQRELVDGQKDIIDTTAGKAIKQGLDAQLRQREVELMEILEGIDRVLEENDEDMRRWLEEEARRQQEWMEVIARDSERMSVNYIAEKERVTTRIKGMERGEQKRERDEANHTHKFWGETNVADRKRSEQQAERPQNLTGITTTIPSDAQIASPVISYVRILFLSATQND